MIELHLQKIQIVRRLTILAFSFPIILHASQSSFFISKRTCQP